MKLLKTLALALAGAGLLAGPAAAQKKWETVRIATEGAYAPWNFSGPGGKLDGFEIELANDLCARMKVKCEIVAQDWDGIIPALQAGKYDAIMAGMSITDERRKVIDFTRAYANAPNGLLAEKSSDLAKMPGTGSRFNLDKDMAGAQKAIDAVKAALKGKTIGVQGSTTHAAFADKFYKGAAEIREYKTTEQHDLDLAAGRIDAVLADSTALLATLAKSEFKDHALVGPGFVGGVLGGGVGAGIRKADADLKKMFDDAIAAATADGTVKRLSEKWFKIDAAPQS
jgi:octopine/nopaline transport system substrate-binding protein